MITLIHGADGLSSFTALKKILDHYDELSITRLAGSDLNLNSIREAVETPSFTGPRLIMIEDLASSRSQALISDLKKYFQTVVEAQEVVIYERKLLPPESPILKLADKVQTFPGIRGLSVFDWTDNVGGRKIGEAVTGYDSLVHSGEEPEYLLLMLARQFRMLILLSHGEQPKVPDFVLRKLQYQLKVWKPKELTKVYMALLDLDVRNKTGEMPLQVGIPTFISSLLPQ